MFWWVAVFSYKEQFGLGFASCNFSTMIRDCNVFYCLHLLSGTVVTGEKSTLDFSLEITRHSSQVLESS